MSKAAKQSLIILGVLLVAAFVFAGLTLSQKIEIEKAKVSLESDLEQRKIQERTLALQNKQLEEKLAEIDKSRAELEKQIAEFKEVNIEELKGKVAELTAEKSKWEQMLAAGRKERDELIKKLEEKPEKEIVHQYVEKEKEAQPAPVPAVPVDEDSYWAQVLKEKAGMKLEMDELKQRLSSLNVELVEVKKQNSDLQLELSGLKNKSEDIARNIKRGSDLADTLSLELARTQNERKFINDQMSKINGENDDLREKIKQLTSTKIALEKSIVLLQEERKGIEKKLLETENVIQHRIDEVWQIKQDIDQRFKPAKARQQGQIELPPIVVSANGSANGRGRQGQPGFGKPAADVPGEAGGNIVSVNEENNFVIVDIGKSSGLNLGDNLGVYRGVDYVAGLEVIQVREDIAAADIKNKISAIKVGDVVR